MEDFHFSNGSDSETNVLLQKDTLLTNNLTKNNRKNSFVWKYYRAISGNTTSFECVVCNGRQNTSNLARHLAITHNITKSPVTGTRLDCKSGGRASRSFIWNYCTKESPKHARCHLCNKLLYFGGGNTSNISKHLRRKHLHAINNQMELIDEGAETSSAAANIMNMDNASASEVKTENEQATSQAGSGRKERRGGSYVWNYCDKLSRNNIRCNLCNKMMSFHGTANVITHLQRRHNILGKDEGDNTVSNTGGEIAGDGEEEELGDDEEEVVEFSAMTKRRRRSTAMSVVWKYCTRISTDTVRCKFCKKNLSYQGTSNLQRHLHRMHRVSTNGRVPKATSDDEPDCPKLIDSDFIWEHCSLLANDAIKCNMCSAVFNSKELTEIGKHLTVLHAIKPTTAGRRRTYNSVEASSVDDFEDDSTGKFGKSDDELMDDRGALIEAKIKKDESLLYNDIIEEEHELTNDEDPFDPAMLSGMPFANPLSPQSSDGDVREPTATPRKANKQLQKLHEDRMRMETEYFREKAGFYRMQKYLAALQAKKLRFEMEQLKSNAQLNGAYTISMDPPPQVMQQHLITS